MSDQAQENDAMLMANECQDDDVSGPGISTAPCVDQGHLVKQVTDCTVLGAG
jgi:hypothetical protein